MLFRGGGDGLREGGKMIIGIWVLKVGERCCWCR